MKKKLLVVAGVIIVIAVVVIVLVLLNLNKIVEVGVEQGGTMVLGVDTTLDSASVSLLGGSAALNGLRIGSPEGFKAAKIFSLDQASAEVEIASIRTDEIVVRKVVFDGPDITLEFGLGKTNWGTLLKKLESEPSEEEKQPGKRVAIDLIAIRNAKIRLAGLPGLEKLAVPLPAIEIRGLRTADGKGVQARQVLRQVITSLLTSMLQRVRSALSSENFKDIAGQLGPMLDNSMKSLEDAGKALRKALKPDPEKAKKALEGLLRGKDKQGPADKGEGLLKDVLKKQKKEPAAKKGKGLLDGLLGKDKKPEK